jgi:hypothetical protein
MAWASEDVARCCITESIARRHLVKSGLTRPVALAKCTFTPWCLLSPGCSGMLIGFRDHLWAVMRIFRCQILEIW